MHGARIFSPSRAADLERDPKCNDETLKEVMEEVPLFSLKIIHVAYVRFKQDKILDCPK